MRLRETITARYANGILDVYNLERHVIHQPFDSDDGGPFTDEADAMAWLAKYYPEYFTP